MLLESGYIHYLQGDIHTSCPTNLEKLKDRDYLIDNFNRQGIIIKELDNFMVSLKSAPYSPRDCMVIYSGEDSSKIKISDFNKKELSELFDIIISIYNGLSLEYKSDFESGTKELLLGLNTSFKPGENNIQSVSRPHFHITVLSSLEIIENNVKTEFLSITNSKEHKAFFCIRELNNILNSIFLDNIKNDKIKLFHLNSGIQSIDFYLEDNNILFSDKNISSILSVYKQAVKTINNFTYKFVGYMNNPSFSIGFKKQGDKFIMRVRFFNKKYGDNGGSMVSFLHKINRDKVNKPKLPDMSNFSKIIEGIL